MSLCSGNVWQQLFVVKLSYRQGFLLFFCSKVATLASCYFGKAVLMTSYSATYGKDWILAALVLTRVFFPFKMAADYFVIIKVKQRKSTLDQVDLIANVLVQ